ncbi:MAG: hypothetical protein VX278_08005, partial [Myxococcota bacterium]|nr:hypothetical protein [Myxococcota bacterium]
MSELRSLLLILCVAAVVAGVGAIQEVDQISLWILAFVDQLPPFAWLKPYQLPPPANSEYGFRPISVLMLKLYIYFFGAKALPPLWVLFLKAWLSASLLGFASWRWLRIQGMQKPALPVACMTILLSPHLFGLWSLAELDGLGAASILGVSILLAKPDRVYVENLSLGILIAFSALLKESSALLLFAIMAAEVWISVRKKENWKPRLYWLGVSVFIWLVWASPLIFGLKSNVGAAPWQLRIPLVGFTAWQLLFFASVPGVCLLLSSVVKRPWLPTILGVSLFFLPPMVWINHYETIYFSPLWIGVVFSILLYGALFYIAFGPKQRPKQAGVALRILAAKGALITALLLSSSPREDLATRIFLPVAPMLMALIMHRNKGYVSRWDRYAARFLWISCCWFWIGNGINGVIERRAREPLHRKGLVSLVEEPMEKGMVLFNNFAYRLGPESLQTLRPDASVPDIV